MANASIKASRSRNIFVIFAITMTTSMIIAIALYFIGARQQAKNDVLGRYQAALIDVSEKEIDTIRANENIHTVGMTYYIDNLNIEDYSLTTMYMDENMLQLNKYPDLQGSLPKSQNEIVVSTSYLSHIKSSAKIGDKIPLTISSIQGEYTISGILSLEDSTKNFTVIVSKDLISSIDESPMYSAYFCLKNSGIMDPDGLKEEIGQISAEAGIKKNDIVYSTYYFSSIEQQTTQDMKVIVGVCALVALACALVIYNLFYISVIGKTNEYGRLRIIGTTKKQIKKIVFRESFYLSRIAIPLGIILGSFIGYILVPGGWSTTTSISVVCISALIVYLIVILSTHKPVELAAKTTPLEALKHVSYNVSTKKSSTKRLRRNITPFRLAFINLARNKKKAALTILSLGICGILFMSSSAYLNSIDFDSMAEKDFPYGDIKIELGVGGSETYSSREYLQLQKDNPLNNKLLDTVSLIDGVKNIKAYSGFVMDTSIPSGYTEPFTIDGYSKNDLQLLKSHLIKGTVDYETLVEKNGVVINNMGEWKDIYDWDTQLGDKLSIQDSNGNASEFVVMGIVDSNIPYGGFNMLFIPNEILLKLQREIASSNYQLVIDTEEEKNNSVEEKVGALISSFSNLEMSTLKERAAIYKSSLDNQKLPVYILTIFIGIFGIVNLLNTLITNVLVRKTELSVFQTLGLSGKQLSKMLLIEGMIYSLGTAIITLTIGTGSGFLLCKLFNTIGVFGTVTYRFPIWSIITYFTILLILQMTFSFVSIKLFQQQSLVERIKNI